MRSLAVGGTLGLCLAVSAVAAAAPPGETPPLETITYREKSETTATVLTLAGIAAPGALAYLLYEPNTDNPIWAPVLLLGSIPGPALGHWYSNRIGTYGMLWRLGAFTMLGLGFGYLDDADHCEKGLPIQDGPCTGSERAIGQTTIGLGVAAWAGSWVYDVLSARRETRRFNAEHTFTVMPIAARDTTGLAVGGRF